MTETSPERKKGFLSRLFLIGTLMRFLGNILADIGDGIGLFHKKRK